MFSLCVKMRGSVKSERIAEEVMGLGNIHLVLNVVFFVIWRKNNFILSI